MPSTNLAFVTTDLLVWARERRDLTREDAAKKIQVKPEKLGEWESGEAQPTFRQARLLADKLNVPFGYFFLSERPSDELILPDLRTVPNAAPEEPSPEFSDVLSDALRKQQWFREYQQEEGAAPLSFIGRFNSRSSAAEVARDIAGTFEIDNQLRKETTNWDQFLRELIRRAEDLGIIVMRSGVVGNNGHRPLDVAEFRGFAISDTIAPLIFINSKDARAAQNFTLAHELAHLWIGETGVSNPDFRKKSSEQANSIERLCNRIAAELLIPRTELLNSWAITSSLDANLARMSAKFRVSRVVILRQAFDSELIGQTTYWTQYKKEIQKGVKTKDDDDEGGGDFYLTLFARASRLFTTTVIAATSEGRVLHRDAARLLNVRVRTLDRVGKRILGESLLNA